MGSAEEEVAEARSCLDDIEETEGAYTTDAHRAMLRAASLSDRIFRLDQRALHAERERDELREQVEWLTKLESAARAAVADEATCPAEVRELLTELDKRQKNLARHGYRRG